jgi:hypothetical protein
LYRLAGWDREARTLALVLGTEGHRRCTALGCAEATEHAVKVFVGSFTGKARRRHGVLSRLWGLAEERVRALTGRGSRRADNGGCLGLGTTSALLLRLGQVVHLILDLVAFSLVGGKLLLVDCHHTLLLASIVPHLVKLRSELSDLSVELTDTLLQVVVLALVSLKLTSHLSVLVLEILVGSLDHNKVLLQLPGLVTGASQSVLQCLDSLDLLVILGLELR